MKPPDTPNLDKMLEVSAESNEIGAFLDWLLHERYLHICKEVETCFDLDSEDTECPTCGTDQFNWETDTLYHKHDIVHGNEGINRLLAEYFEIDYDGMEQERRALLEWVHARNEEKE